MKTMLITILLLACTSLQAQTPKEIREGLQLLTNSRQLGQAPVQACDPGVSLSLGFINDNKLYTLLDRELPPVSGPGDDVHYTHGYLLMLEKVEAGKWRLSITLAGDLYGQPIQGQAERDEQGRWHVSQHFVEHYQLKAQMDSKPTRQFFYWRAGGGVEALNSNDLGIGLLAPSTQQTAFHNVISDNTPFQLKNRIQVSDGEATRWGALAHGGVGIQKQLLTLGDESLEVVVFSEASLHGHSLPQASSLQQQNGLDISAEAPAIPILGRPTIELSLHSTLIVHTQGILWAPTARAQAGVERLSLGLEWKGQYGDLQNYQRYNLPHLQGDRNDDLMTVYLKSSF